MFNQPFYHSTLKKLVAGFGKLFANIYVVRTNTNGTEKERIQVPLAYGPAEKYLARLAEDPNLDRGYSIKLPRMSFEIKTVQYDSTRKLNTIRKNVQPIEGDPGTVLRQYQGVPYDIQIDLSILSKYIDDANQIVEQILPWFTPAYTITLNTIPDMNYKDDVPVILSGIALNDNYEDDWKNRRDVVWTLSFTVRAMFYGPVIDKKIVTKAQIDIHGANNTLDFDGNISGVPRHSRITATPEDDTAEYNEDFGYSITVETFNDNKSLNPVSGVDEEATFKINPQSAEYVSKVGRPKLS